MSTFEGREALAKYITQIIHLCVPFANNDTTYNYTDVEIFAAVTHATFILAGYRFTANTNGKQNNDEHTNDIAVEPVSKDWYRLPKDWNMRHDNIAPVYTFYYTQVMDSVPHDKPLRFVQVTLKQRDNRVIVRSTSSNKPINNHVNDEDHYDVQSSSITPSDYLTDNPSHGKDPVERFNGIQRLTEFSRLIYQHFIQTYATQEASLAQLHQILASVKRATTCSNPTEMHTLQNNKTTNPLHTECSMLPDPATVNLPQSSEIPRPDCRGTTPMALGTGNCKIDQGKALPDPCPGFDDEHNLLNNPTHIPNCTGIDSSISRSIGSGDLNPPGLTDAQARINPFSRVLPGSNGNPDAGGMYPTANHPLFAHPIPQGLPYNPSSLASPSTVNPFNIPSGARYDPVGPNLDDPIFASVRPTAQHRGCFNPPPNNPFNSFNDNDFI